MCVLLYSAKIAGIFTIMSYTICPAYLFIRSRQAIVDAKLPTISKYTTMFSSNVVAWALILLASALIVGVIFDAIMSFASVAEEGVGTDQEIPADEDLYN